MNVAVVGIVLCKNKVLIGKKGSKGNGFLKGAWHIPGGHTENGEDEHSALIRELKEETNLDIKIIKKISEQLATERNLKILWYLCTSNSDKAIPGDDLEKVKFVDPGKVIEACDKRAVSLWPKEVIDFFSKPVTPPEV